MNKDIQVTVLDEQYDVMCNVDYNGENLKEEFNRFDIYDAEGNCLADIITVSEFNKIKTAVNEEITRLADKIIEEFENDRDEWDMYSLDERY